MPIVRKRIYLGTYVVIDFDHKVTNSSPLTRKMTSKRLYFNYFKDRLVHFNGTAMITNIFNALNDGNEEKAQKLANLSDAYLGTLNAKLQDVYKKSG